MRAALRAHAPIPSICGSLLFALGAALCGLLAKPASGQTREITWALVDWPPIYILPTWATPRSSTELGNGMSDRLMAAILPRMAGYQHHFIRTSIPRVWTEIAQGNALCYASALKTPEREKVAYFTSALLVPPLHVVMRDDHAHAVAQGKSSLMLATLVARTDVTGYVEDKRSFNPALDAILNAPSSKIHRMVVPQMGHVMRMLDGGRMDYTIEYPFVVEYLRQQARYQHDITVLPIDEAPDSLISYIACTKNERGKQAIRDIDAAIREAVKTPFYRQALADWLAPPVRQRYQSTYDAFFSYRATHPDVPPD